MVDREKQRRLFRAAEAWLSAHASDDGLDVDFEVLALADGELRRLPRRSVVGGRTSSEPWLGRRMPSTARSTSSSWSERDLPEQGARSTSIACTRTSASYPPARRSAARALRAAGGRVLDPFAGSGTTLVQALESGHDATGVDIAAFNALLMRVKTARYNLFALEHEDAGGVRPPRASTAGRRRAASPFVRRWFAPKTTGELTFRSLIGDYEHRDMLESSSHAPRAPRA